MTMTMTATLKAWTSALLTQVVIVIVTSHSPKF